MSGSRVVEQDTVIEEILTIESLKLTGDVGDIALLTENNEVWFSPPYLLEYRKNLTPIGVVLVPSEHNMYNQTTLHGRSSAGVLSLNWGRNDIDTGGAYEKYTRDDRARIDTYFYSSKVFEVRDAVTDKIFYVEDNYMVPETNAVGGLIFGVEYPDGYLTDISDEDIVTVGNTTYCGTYSNSVRVINPFTEDGGQNPEFSKRKTSYKLYNCIFSNFEDSFESHDGSVIDVNFKSSYYHTPGTNAGEWKFLAPGEFAYLFSKYFIIEDSLKKVKEVFGDDKAYSILEIVKDGDVFKSNTGTDINICHYYFTYKSTEIKYSTIGIGGTISDSGEEFIDSAIKTVGDKYFLEQQSTRKYSSYSGPGAGDPIPLGQRFIFII